MDTNKHESAIRQSAITNAEGIEGSRQTIHYEYARLRVREL